MDVTEITLKALWALRSSGLILIDRLALEADDSDAPSRSRLAEAVASAYATGDGELVLLTSSRGLTFPDSTKASMPG